ncbi:MAG: anhydro-N-acetylmuramic acid kinase [Acidobacteriota bacterium]
MRVCGIMSGTSLDGIDVAIVDLNGRSIQPVALHSAPYPKAVREAILGVSNVMAPTGAIARLHFLLGELYAEAVIATCRKHRVPLKSVELCGMHGQTIFHEGTPVNFLGRKIASTLQIGDPSVFAERTGIRTISNFRERDIAAGGKGAPLVPYVDYLLFHHRRKSRVALNIGGIANITVIPAGAKREQVIAFDTGPGNMVIDALISKYTDGKQTYDLNGRIAQKAEVHERLLTSMLSDPYFTLKPPKSAGREQFGQEFASGLIATGIPIPDLIATATELTACSIAKAIQRHAPKTIEVIVSGGGVHNRWLMERLRNLIDGPVLSSEILGVDPDAKEALAFAVLAREFVRRRPSNLLGATGARRNVLLGRDTPG